ncbi:hypothetical protein TNCV_46081 [Trichonephila clavipes]|nr:hypothetical protein TNCV_46081 [Trichonephila clavipes]
MVIATNSCSPSREFEFWLPLKNHRVEGLIRVKSVEAHISGMLELGEKGCQFRTATAGSDVVQSGRPIFNDFFQHLWPYIGNNTANVVFQMVKDLWLIRIDQ